MCMYGHRKQSQVTTDRTSAERYTFPAGKANILLNLGEGLTNETGAWVRKVSDTEIEGMRLLGTFCYNPQAVFPIYFVMRVSKTPAESGYWKKQRPMTGVEAEWTPDNGKYKLYTRYGRDMAGDDIGYWFTFDAEEGEQIEVQMGVSFVSTENARENLDAEQDGFNFDKVRAEAAGKWAFYAPRRCTCTRYTDPCAGGSCIPDQWDHRLPSPCPPPDKQGSYPRDG